MASRRHQRSTLPAQNPARRKLPPLSMAPTCQAAGQSRIGKMKQPPEVIDRRPDVRKSGSVTRAPTDVRLLTPAAPAGAESTNIASTAVLNMTDGLRINPSDQRLVAAAVDAVNLVVRYRQNCVAEFDHGRRYGRFLTENDDFPGTLYIAGLVSGPRCQHPDTG